MIPLSAKGAFVVPILGSLQSLAAPSEGLFSDTPSLISLIFGSGYQTYHKVTQELMEKGTK